MINLDDRILAEVDENQLFLLCAIAKHMGNNSKAWPSNETLCKTTKWSESKLLRVKKSAIEAGLLGAESRYINNAQTSNLYQIKTRRIGVMVNLADIAPPSTNEAPPPSLVNTPPLQEWRTEVLTNEVLTNEQQQEGAAAAAELLIRSTTEIEGVTLVEKMTVEAEKKQEDRVPPPPSARPAPGESAPRRYDAFDIDREAESLKADPLAAERFARETGTLAAQMYEALGKMVDTFTSDQKTTGYNYNNRIDYRKHFFNLVRKKQEIKRNAPAVQKPFGQTVVDTPSQYRKLSQF